MTDEQSKILTYGEIMMLCEGHGTSKIYERHLEALHAAELRVWEEAAKLFEKAFEQNMVVQDVLDLCRQQAEE